MGNQGPGLDHANPGCGIEAALGRQLPSLFQTCIQPPRQFGIKHHQGLGRRHARLGAAKDEQIDAKALDRFEIQT